MPEITYRQAIHDAMVEEMRRDERVFLMGEDIGTYGGAFGVSAGMLEEFGPERIVETPISEEAIIGAAAGAAMVPMGLAVGGRMLKPVKMGEAIRYEDIELREDDLICKLRREQDKLLYS